MKIIQWNKKISVNNIKIDNQHKKLIDLVNKLAEHSKVDTNSELINETLSELLRYSSNHFRDEEELMKKANYPKLNQHIIKHKYFLYKIATFCADVQNGKSNVTKKLLQFLINELIEHTNVYDQDYKNYI